MHKKTQALDNLFSRWISTYMPAQRDDFHRDGIVDEPMFSKSLHRVLFIVLEPNTKDGMYDQYRGCDLRTIWRTVPQGKQFNLNVARWTSVILDRSTTFWKPTAVEAMDRMRRVAIINLKKIAGSGRADYGAIEDYFKRDKAFINEQVAIIDPTIVIACGVKVCNIIGFDRPKGGPESWDWNGRVVILGNHPSLRPADAPAAFSRLVDRVRRIGVLGPGGGTGP